MKRTKLDNIKGAFTAWEIAISYFFGESYPAGESIPDLASQFGRDITDKESLKVVSQWFNWDKITSYLKSDENRTA